MATHDVDEAILTSIGFGQATRGPAIVNKLTCCADRVSVAVSRLIDVIAECRRVWSPRATVGTPIRHVGGSRCTAPRRAGAHGLRRPDQPTRAVSGVPPFLIDIARPEAVLQPSWS